jgi:hypothetical protein
MCHDTANVLKKLTSGSISAHGLMVIQARLSACMYRMEKLVERACRGIQTGKSWGGTRFIYYCSTGNRPKQHGKMPVNRDNAIETAVGG